MAPFILLIISNSNMLICAFCLLPLNISWSHTGIYVFQVREHKLDPDTMEGL